jgi:CrcB protein
MHAEYLRALLLIGFLGGFTTFSSFSIETFNLFENGEVIKSLLNIICSFSFCLLAVSLGAVLGRQL